MAAKWKQRGEVTRKRIKETPFATYRIIVRLKGITLSRMVRMPSRVSNLDHLKEVNIDRRCRI